MSVTAIGPASILDVPRPVAPPYGLLSVPGVLAAETRGRWLNGVNTFGFPVQDTWTWDPCSTGTFRVKSEESEVSTERFDAFGVGASIACGTLGLPDDFLARLEASFDAVLSKAVEKAVSQGSEVTTNPTLGDTNMTVLNSGTAVTPEEGLAWLENALPGVRGIIHAVPAVVSRWGFEKLKTDGEAIYTPNGNYVAAGAGYIGAQPSGQSEPGDTEAWTFVTAGLEVRLSDRQVLSPEIAESLDRSTNDVVYRVEEFALATWDSALVQAGVLIDWSVT